jgi:hypothetical protein
MGAAPPPQGSPRPSGLSTALNGERVRPDGLEYAERPQRLSAADLGRVVVLLGKGIEGEAPEIPSLYYLSGR